ncbi:MAG: 16S rRNA (cytosine(1402)-N(4))-methyltransferase RsmH [Desulfobacterales bacterium]|nr:16S rRNA (cytosine(1402)-N(4))-methyltransferase RsmH [Desulfobacterales bacterium]
MTYKHISVMQKEVLYYLNCQPGKIYVDGTLGGSGHAKAILEKIIPNGILIGIDQDSAAIENAEKVLESYKRNIYLFHDNFANLPEILSQLNIAAVDGILLDLGISLYHIESSGRGFSFKKDEPLDMRMDTQSKQTAAELVNGLSEKNLKKIFKEYGEERWAGPIARKIVKARKDRPIESSKDLADLVSAAIPKNAVLKLGIHPATKVFMALRIAVNRELEKLDFFLENFVNLLNPKGRLCILSFHSLEDRMVKHRIKDLEKNCICPPEFPKCVCSKQKQVRSLTRKVRRPTEEEIALNPMSRSTRLRAVEKI